MKLLTKSVVVATVLCFVAGLSAGAAVSSYSPAAGDLFSGQNLFALPVVPTDADGGGPGYPEWILAGFDLTGTNLQRWDAATQAMISRPTAGFGNLLSTDAYWFTAPSTIVPTSIAYNGANDLQQTDYWISLPKAGTTVVGNPYLYAVDWNKISVTNGMTTVDIDTAITNGWLSSTNPVAGFDNSWKNAVAVPIGPASAINSTNRYTLRATRLEPWRGYLVSSLVDNLALIVTARKATDTVYSISGNLTFSNISTTTRWPKVPVIFELRDNATGAKILRTVKHVDSAGFYSIDGVAPGTYKLCVKGMNTIGYISGAITVAAANVTGINCSLVSGDIDGNNRVNSADYALYVPAYGAIRPAALYDIRADLDANDRVNSADYSSGYVPNYGVIGTAW